MQDDCCQCYHSRRLGKSLHIPLSRCSAIPEYVNHLGFLTERFSSPPIHQCNASTFLAYLFTSYLSPSTQGFRKDEKPIQFLSILLKNFHIINITKKLKFLYIYKTFFCGMYRNRTYDLKINSFLLNQPSSHPNNRLYGKTERTLWVIPTLGMTKLFRQMPP